MARYEVVVGNIGSVYRGSNKDKAVSEYNSYVKDSKNDYGRGGGEDVALFKDDEIIREYFSTTKDRG